MTNLKKFNGNVWAHWQEWITRIQRDLGGTAEDGANFERFRGIINANSDWIDQNSGGWFIDLFVRSYISHVAIGIRRQMDTSDQCSVSLANLANEMATYANELTFGFYLSQFPQTGVPWQQLAFNHMSTDGKVVSADLVRQHIEELQQLSRRIKQFVNKTVAHHDYKKYGKTEGFTFADLKKIITEFDSVAVKFVVFLTGEGYNTLVPVNAFNQLAIFRVPLIDPTKSATES